MNKVKAGEAYVSISVDNSGLKAGLKVAGRQLTDFEKYAAIGVTVSVDGIRSAVEKVAELQSRFLTLQGVTGETAASLKGLEETAKRLGASTSWTAAQVADGMTALARLGMTVDQIGGTIAPVMDLAKGLGVSIDAAAGMVGASINQFGLKATDAAHVTDVLAKATNGAAISQTELAESMKYAGTAGAQAGQSLESITALVMTLRNAGLTAEQAGTAVRTLFLALQDSKKGAAFGSVFGVSLKDSAGNLRDITAILGDASKRAEQFGGNLSTALADIGIDTAAIGAISVLLRDAGKLPAVASSLKDSTNYAADLAGTIDSGIAGTFARASSAVDGLAIAFGDALAPAVSTAVQQVTTLADDLTFLVKGNEKVIEGVAKSAAKFGVLAVSAKGVAKAFDALKSGYKAASTFAKTLSSINVIGNKGGAFSGVVDAENVNAFAAGISKAKKSAAELSAQFADIKAGCGDAEKAQTEFAKRLQDTNKLTATEAAAVSDVARRVDAGTVSQKKFDAAVKAAKASASALSGVLKTAAAGVASMVIINVVADAGKALFNWFNKSFERAKGIREELEKAAETEKAARRQALDKSGASSTVDTIKELFDYAKRWDSLTQEEKGNASKKLIDARNAGIINDADYKRLNSMTNGGAYTAGEWSNVEQETIKGALNRSTAQAQRAAAETVGINAKTVLNKFYGTTDKSADELAKRARTGQSELDAAAGKVAGALASGIQRAQAVAQNAALTDAEKRIQIATIKKETRLSIESQKNNAQQQLQGFGAGGKYSLNFADRRQFSQMVDGADAALNTFEESIDSAVKAIEFAQEAAVINATAPQSSPDAAFNFLDQSEQPATLTRKDFKGTTANDYQLGLIGDDTDGAKADADAADALREQAEAARESAKATAADAVAKLKSTDLENITAAQIKNTLQKLKAAESMGIDVSDDRAGLRELFGNMADKLANAVEFKTTVQSRVIADAVGASFSLANNSNLDCQRQQLSEMRKLAEQSAAQYQVCAQILQML